MSQPSLRADLALLPRYVAGKTVRAVDGFKLSSNELAADVSGAVVASAASALASMNRYPDLAGADLVERLSRHLGVGAERVVAGGGSIAVLQQLIQAVVEPGRAVVFGWRSYEAYPILARVCHAAPTPVPLRDHRHDLPAMLEEVRRTDAAMVIVCNPNNPTGTAVTESELGRFLDEVPPACLVVLDEAYREFVSDAGFPDGLELAGDRENVVVLRTFSKAHGLAGLRVGYGVAPVRVADAVRAVAMPFTVSGVGQAAAIAALDAWPEQRLVVDDVITRRDAFADDLRRCGVDTPRSQSNFVWIPAGQLPEAFVDGLSTIGVSAREFVGDGVRITIGEPEALQRVTRLLHRLTG